MQGGNYQLLLILIVFGFSALSWVIGQLRQQAAIKKTRDQMSKAREEELRTGRHGEPKPVQTRSGELAELRELAMKRQQQIQQMRTAQQRGTTGMQARAPDPALRIPTPQFPLPNTPGRPTGPGIPMPPGQARPGRPGAPGVPNPVRRAGAGGRLEDIRPPTPAQRPQHRPKSQARLEEDTHPAYATERSAPRRLVTDAEDPTNSVNAFADREKRSTAPIGLAALLGTQGQKPTPSEMRRAIILSEILSPPLANRPPAEA